MTTNQQLMSRREAAVTHAATFVFIEPSNRYRASLRHW